VTNRVGDYCRFAVRFVGLGYIVLWPLATPDPFGLAGYCRRDAPLWHFFCHWPHLLNLTPGLHLIGIFCTGVLGVHLLLRAAAHWRRARARRADAALAFNARLPAALMRTPQRPPFRAPLRKVKPRSHFGLRAAPRRGLDFGVKSAAVPPRPAATEPDISP